MNFKISNITLAGFIIIMLCQYAGQAFGQGAEKTPKKKNKRVAAQAAAKTENIENAGAVSEKHSAGALTNNKDAKTGNSKKTAKPLVESSAHNQTVDTILDEMAKIGLIAGATDSVEFLRVNSAFEESVDNFKKTLIKLIKEIDIEIAVFKNKIKLKNKEDADILKLKSSQAAGERAENLKSLGELMQKELAQLKDKEIKRINGRVDNLFNMFLQTFNNQKSFFTKNSVYDSATSEVKLMFDSFEIELKDKNKKLNGYIEDQFKDIEK